MRMPKRARRALRPIRLENEKMQTLYKRLRGSSQRWSAMARYPGLKPEAALLRTAIDARSK